MKKIFFAMVLLVSSMGVLKAQTLYITNNSCADVDVKLYADDAALCGPAAVDYSNWITVTAGGGTSYNFTGVGPYGLTFPWVSPFGPNLNSTFNFFQADIKRSCVPVAAVGVVSTCGNTAFTPTNLDGVTIYNPSCGSPSTDYFYLNMAYSCGSCNPAGYCQMWTCSSSNPCSFSIPFSGITAVFTILPSGDWNLDIY